MNDFSDELKDTIGYFLRLWIGNREYRCFNVVE